MSQYVTFMFNNLTSRIKKITYFYQIRNQFLKLSIYTHSK